MKHSKENLERIQKNMEEDGRAAARLGSDNKNASAISIKKMNVPPVAVPTASKAER